jgi:YVTN family beta-propeller protein
MATPGFRRSRRRAVSITLAALWLGMVVVLAAVPTPPGTAHADGGAPNLAYVVGGGSDRAELTIIDIAQRRVTGRVHIGGQPHGVMLSLDGRNAYVTQTAADRVAVVDARAQRVVGTIAVGRGPGAIALDSMLTGNLYVADSVGNTVTVVDLAKQRAIATIPVGKRPSSIAIASPASGITNAQDAEVYVANADDDTVSVISAARRQVVATIPVPGGPLSVVVPASGGVAYVGTRAGQVLALGLADHRLLGPLLQLRGPASGAMDYDGISGQIYVPDPTGGVVDVLRPASVGSGADPNLPAEPARTLTFGGGPAAVAITFDGAFGFVAERDAGRVAMFDVASHQTLATITVGGAPQAIITGSYPPVLSPGAANVVGILSYVFVGVVLLAIAAFYLGWFQALGRRLRRGTPAGARGSK